MKLNLSRQAIMTYLRELANHLAVHRLFWLATAVAIVAAVLVRYIWQVYGDHSLVSAGSIDIVISLVLLNFLLALLALPREPFASTLLIGAALLEEALVILFLYQV